MEATYVVVELAKFLVIILASVGAGAWFRYHAVECGIPRLWDAAPLAGVVGAFGSMAIFTHAGSVPERLVVAGLAALWYAVYDHLNYRNSSYPEQRRYRETYGQDDWVDALFDDERCLEEVAD